MSSSLPSRRRAGEFARILDTAAGAPATNDPTLAPLATLAMALRSLPVGPAPDFRAGLRQRLVAVATVQGVGVGVTAGVIALPGARPAAPKPAVSWRVTEWAEGWRVRRRLVAATAAMSAVVMVGGVGLAGSRSLPGEPFYGVKRGVESIQLAAARGDEAKGERHLQFAETRLTELSALVGSTVALGSPGSGGGPVASGLAFGGSLTSRVLSTLRAMDHETRAGTRDLTKAYQNSRNQKPLRTLSQFASEQTSRLTAVLPSLPTSVTLRADESLALVKQIGTETDGLLLVAECTAACEATTTPPGVTKTPEPGATPNPCTCSSSGSVDATGTPDTSGGTQSEPTPSRSPGPGHSRSPATTSPSPSPSPTSPTLQDQIGSIISQLPLPVPTPPLPLPDLPVPNPLPTISLP